MRVREGLGLELGIRLGARNKELVVRLGIKLGARARDNVDTHALALSLALNP